MLLFWYNGLCAVIKSNVRQRIHYWVGSVGRASDLRSKDLRFEPCQEHKKNVKVFPSQKCCADSLSACPTPECIRTHKNDHVRTLRVLQPMSRVQWITETRKDPACTSRTG